MGFLSGVAAQVIQYFLGKLIAWGFRKAKEAKHEAEIDDRTKAEGEALAKAKTEQEILDATKGSLDNI